MSILTKLSDGFQYLANRIKRLESRPISSLNGSGGGINYELDKEIQTNDTWLNDTIYFYAFTTSIKIPTTTWTLLVSNFPYNIKSIIRSNIYELPTSVVYCLNDYHLSYNYPNVNNLSIYTQSNRSSGVLKYILLWYTKTIE